MVNYTFKPKKSVASEIKTPTEN